MAAGDDFLRFRVTEWRPRRRGKMVGQVRVVIGGVLEFTALPVFRQSSGGYFCALPSSRYVSPATGKVSYIAEAKFVEKETGARFSEAVVAYLLKEFPETFEEEDDGRRVGLYSEIEENVPF